MHISKMMDSKYVTKDDVGQGKTVTIERLEQQDVSMQDQPTEMKWVMYFVGARKGLVLNATNIHLIAQLHGDDTDNWIGKPVTLWNDPSVSYAGKMTGGVRVKMPVQEQQAMQSPPQAAPAEYVPGADEFDDPLPDVPF